VTPTEHEGIVVTGRGAASDALRLGAALLLGSVPVSNMISRAAAGRDLRYVGTCTVSPSNLYHVGGIGPFAAACALDIGKGAISAVLVRHRRPALVAAAAGLPLVGHDWSLFQGGAGGRGVLPATGILMVAAIPGAALVGGGIVVGYAAGDTAPAYFAAQLLLVPALAATRGRGGALLGLALAAPMLAKRLLGKSPLTQVHLRQTYVTRMIYDRDTRSGRGGGPYRR
jgi:glycerol-3-phosphate acyltransferase PlsY